MTNQAYSSFVPASLVRIRCFLNRRGMKVRPWLGPAAVLEAFHDVLRSRSHDDSFWSELQELLTTLADDMNTRLALRGWAVQNELLDSSQHAELLSQIRAALRANGVDSPSLHPLARMLPSRAGALLLMLAAAIVVGCTEDTKVDAAHGTGGANAASGGFENAAGGSTGTNGGLGGAGPITISLGGSLPASCQAGSGGSGLDPAEFAACNPALVSALIPYDIHTNQGKQLLECACLLSDAWQTGLAELFAGEDCKQILDYFGRCGVTTFCGAGPAGLPSEFDADLLLDNCMVVLYLGVRAD